MQALYSILIIAITLYNNALMSRSCHRPNDPSVPIISVRWAGECELFHLRHTHLERRVFFDLYDRSYLMQFALPNKGIINRTSNTLTDTSILKELIDELVYTLQTTTKKITDFKDFIILKQRDYNPKKHAGLIILKFKNYPFVVKLFMETPQSFVQPYSKGIEPCAFLTMGGGVQRYLSGFTRIRNLEMIREHIKQDPYWSTIIDTPRKWYYEPRGCRSFEVLSSSFSSHEECIQMPSAYALICDAINSDNTFTLLNKKNRRLAMQLCHFLGMRVDPHIDNFMVEKETQKIVLVDTEHFPTMVGLRKNLQFKSYFSWYGQLVIKCISDTWCRDKQQRIIMRNAPFEQDLIFTK